MKKHIIIFSSIILLLRGGGIFCWKKLAYVAVFPLPINDWLNEARTGWGLKRKTRILWRYTSRAQVREIQKERNRRIFYHKATNFENICNYVQFTYSVRCLKHSFLLTSFFKIGRLLLSSCWEGAFSFLLALRLSLFGSIHILFPYQK